LVTIREVDGLLDQDRQVDAGIFDAVAYRVRARVRTDPDRAGISNERVAREERDRDESEQDGDEPDDPLADENREIDLAPTHALSSRRSADGPPLPAARRSPSQDTRAFLAR